MAIGARDFIDKLLVEKYAQEKVDNHDEGALKSHVSADDMMSAMNCYWLDWFAYTHISTKRFYNIISVSVNSFINNS